MGKKKGNTNNVKAKDKDPSHARKHSSSQPLQLATPTSTTTALAPQYGATPATVPTAWSQPHHPKHHRQSSSQPRRASSFSEDDPDRNNEKNDDKDSWWNLPGRFLYSFCTKYLPYFLLAYITLAFIVLLHEIIQGKIRIEFQGLTTTNADEPWRNGYASFPRPGVVLKTFRTTLYDLILFRHDYYRYIIFGGVGDNNKKYHKNNHHHHHNRWYFSRSRHNERFLDDAAARGQSNTGSTGTTTNSNAIVDPHSPRAILFAVLREAIVREPGGYVHPDLGILQPAPSGAIRGIGMVRNTYHQCQTDCFPSGDREIMEQRRKKRRKATTTNNIGNNNTTSTTSTLPRYQQQDILIRVPLSYQMNRKVAIEAIVPLLPSADKAANLADLDDPTLLVLLLAHERSKKRYSRWYPYIASLPPQPSCGYWRESRDAMLQSLAAYRARFDKIDMDGWEDELYKATEYGETIVRQLAAEYGPYLFKDTKDNHRIYRRIAWALCHVASRATAAYGDHGSLRLIPMLDLINHDLTAGGFLELTGKETVENGDSLDARLDEEGTFIVRSLRHGRRKPLKVGQELLVNYNVPNYSPLDWFISMGYVPPERRSPWLKIDPVLPQLRNEHGQSLFKGGANHDNDSSSSSIPTEQSIKNKERFIEAKLREFTMVSNTAAAAAAKKD
jgi:hypothetical protein